MVCGYPQLLKPLICRLVSALIANIGNLVNHPPPRMTHILLVIYTACHIYPELMDLGPSYYLRYTSI
jgi:hypothetical protein